MVIEQVRIILLNPLGPMLMQSLLCFSEAQRDRSGIPVARQQYIEPIARHNLGTMDHVCPKFGALHWLNERVQKAGSTDSHLLFGMCCGDGNIKLPTPAPAPEPLQHFFSALTPEG